MEEKEMLFLVYFLILGPINRKYMISSVSEASHDHIVPTILTSP